MGLLKFNEIFNDEDISNYDLFIEKLKQVKENGHTTKDILELIYQYYEKYVTYNYDQLQIVKIINQYEHPEIKEVLDKYPSSNITAENIEQLKNEIINDLNEVFLKLEGRSLTKKTIDTLFKEYGKVVHHDERKITMFGKEKTLAAYNEVKGLNLESMQPIYTNGMLREGVCGEYANVFEKKVCKDLGIKHMPVRGKGTTGHAWSLIYLQEEDRWIHFDMTMVKFYQDGWIKKHEPYMEQDWIAATTEEIFKMQPTRKIELINGKKDEKFPITKDNYEELNISKFESTILPEDIGRSTIDVQTEQKENAQAIVNQDVKKHELEENQREGVSIDGK